MSQKLPVLVGAGALLVVVGVWWQTSGTPEQEPVVLDAARMGDGATGLGAGSASAPGTDRPRRNPAEMRARRDAWMEAHEQKRARQGAGAMDSESGNLAAGRLGGSERSGSRPSGSDGDPEARGMPEAGAPATAGAADEDDDSVESLRETALSDADPDERINALWAIAVTDEDAALPVLSSALRDSDREVRLAAVQELGGLDDERGAIDALSLALGDPDSEIRAEAMRLIGDSEDPRAAHLAQQLINDADADVRDEAQAILDALDD